MGKGHWQLAALLLASIACLVGLSASAAVQVPPDPADRVTDLLMAISSERYGLPPDLPLHSISSDDGDITVCFRVPREVLSEGGWMGMEQLVLYVRDALIEMPWETLSVQAWDSAEGRCRPVSDFAPREPVTAPEAEPSTTAQEPAVEAQATSLGSLAGKTVYVSAGHGWLWNTYWEAYRTQRIVYQGFIEDHNNAEVVTQYLIPYLENAGATVVPVRERDWSPVTWLSDDDDGYPTYMQSGTWTIGTLAPGYDGGTYRFASSVAGAPTAQATWTVDVTVPGEYAVYAWVLPGSNRIPDAHYTVHHAGGATETIISQEVQRTTWRYLGTFPFYAGPATITLDNRTAVQPGDVVIADAVRIGGGSFDDLSAIPMPIPTDTSSGPSAAAFKPWWETCTFYWSQWMGMDPYMWSYLNDVVARPIYSRWIQRVTPGDSVYISWHTNGGGGTTRGTVSYVHNETTYPRTPGSTELQAAVHTELVHDIRAGWDASWADLGKRSLDLGELRMLWDPDYELARIPGVLLEIAFHDQPDDANALKEPLFNQLAARGVYQGIVKYFENRDGVDLALLPEPPTHLRVQNVGGGALRVTWSPSPTDGVGLRGDPATGYRVYTSPDGFAWSEPIPVAGTELTIPGLSSGQTVYVRVTGTNAGGESLPTEIMGARVGDDVDLLIVNGFDKLNRFELVSELDPVEGTNLRILLDRINSYAYVVSHGQAVPAEFAWDSAANEAVAAGTVSLMNYEVVDWILGEESISGDGSLNSAERQLLTAYLDAGRSLLITGSEFGWDLEQMGRDPGFLNYGLRTDFIADDAETYTTAPTGLGTFAGLSEMHFDAAGEYDVGFPDVLAPYPGSGATTALTYVGGTGNGQGAAVQYADGCHRLLVLGFPFETIRPAERPALMAAAMNFLACYVDTEITHPEEGGYYDTRPAFTGTARGEGLAYVELRLQRWVDDAFWRTTTGWVAEETWFRAQGIDPWQYQSTIIDMGEGGYTLRARAVGVETDETPDEVSFFLDWTSPDVPTLEAPDNSAELAGPAVELVWSGPADSGSPLHFEVELDGVVKPATATTSYVTVLRPGVHTWRVRAVDAAGNVGGWTATYTFTTTVEPEEIFMPLVLRN
ncbi:MAG: fibronectin type III domain-containing protein [Anaerolineae bacterium]